MQNSITKKLLFHFFAGKTTPIQRKMIEEWLTDPTNEELYYHYLDEWESQCPQFEPNIDESLQKYKSLIKNNNELPSQAFNREVETMVVQSNKWVWYAVAACLLFALSFVFRAQILIKSYQSSIGQTATYHLSDGTQVILNSNSVLQVPRFGFGWNAREVFLNGEAEFKVTHTPNNNRFVVRMDGDYQIEVLGTEFIVSSRKRGKQVLLTKGKVKLMLPKGKQLYMKPGNLFTATSSGLFKITNQSLPEPYSAWKDQMFYFDNTLLSEVLLQLNDRFNINVRIQDKALLNHRIGGIYKAETADDMLQILSDLLHLEVIKKQDFIELRTAKLSR